MAEETPPTIPLSTSEEGPIRSDPKEPPTDINISVPASEDHIPDPSLENTSGNPVMQFVVRNFEQINAMYSTFSSKRKEINLTSACNNDDHPVMEPWRSDSEGSHEDATRRAPEENTLQPKPSKKRSKGDSKKFKAEILGIRQRSDESLRDYLGSFGKETLHMTDRPDGMMTGDFISKLRPGRHVQNHRESTRKHKERYVARPTTRPNKCSSMQRSTFTPLIKSPTKIYATSEEKSILRSSPRMFVPAHQRDSTRYCEFHNDHGHDTNDCVDLRKEIETCVKMVALST
ncbi:hypothetical protein Tco_1364005 [Tanacetum coccineum]